MVEGQNVTACAICEKDLFLWPQCKYLLGKWSKEVTESWPSSLGVKKNYKETG